MILGLQVEERNFFRITFLFKENEKERSYVNNFNVTSLKRMIITTCKAEEKETFCFLENDNSKYQIYLKTKIKNLKIKTNK